MHDAGEGDNKVVIELEINNYATEQTRPHRETFSSNCRAHTIFIDLF